MGIEDLGLSFASGTSDVITGRAQLSPGRFEGGVERSVSVAGVPGVISSGAEIVSGSEVLGPMPMPGDAAVGPEPFVASHRARSGHRFVEVPPHQCGDRCRALRGLGDRRHSPRSGRRSVRRGWKAR